jgi:hypothetical protein
VREFQEAFLSGPAPLGPGASPAERIRAFLHGYVDYLLEPHIELMFMAETASPGARYRSGAYRFHRAHVSALIQEDNPDADAEYLAEALLAPLAADLYVHQRREQEMTIERIKMGLDELLD